MRTSSVPQPRGRRARPSAGPSSPAEPRTGPVADVPGPEQRPAAAGGTVAPFQRPADPAQHAGREGDDDGQDQPDTQPAEEEEPHDHDLPRYGRGNRRQSGSGASRTTILPVLPPRRRSRNAGTAWSRPSRT